MLVWKTGTACADPAYPAHLPNRPFHIDALPLAMPLTTVTRDLVRRFYNNREQINGGKLDQFAALSDAGGIVARKGYVDSTSYDTTSILKFILPQLRARAAAGSSNRRRRSHQCARSGGGQLR